MGSRGDTKMAKRGENGLGLAAERLTPLKKLPPLLVPAGERPPERLHWLGASFGVTGQLLKLWKKAGFKLVYLRQTASELTGEHTGIMLRALDTEGMEEAPQDGWLEAFAADCRRRLVNLLGHEFQSFDCTTALSLVEAAPTAVTASGQGGHGSNSVSKRGDAGGVASRPLGATELSYYCGPHDLKRLELYSRNLVDYHLITDLLPTLSKLYFLGRMPSARMSHLQEAIILAMGLQHRSVTLLSKELQLPDNQILALFNKAVRKLCNWLTQVSERAAENEMESRESKQKRLDTVKSVGEMSMLPASMDEDLEGGAKEAMAKMEGRKQELLESMDLAQYAVKGSEADWEAATKGISDKVGSVSIKSKTIRSSEGQHESSKERKKKNKRDGEGRQGGDEDLGDRKSKKKQKKRKHAD